MQLLYSENMKVCVDSGKQKIGRITLKFAERLPCSRSIDLAVKEYVCVIVCSQMILLYMHLVSYKQKYDNRAVVVREAEMKYWQELSVDFMSLESDDPDDSNSLIVHKLPWCSNSMFSIPVFASLICVTPICLGLTRFIEKLDARYEEKVKKEGILVARKTRKPGSPAKSDPPAGAPDWTVHPEWQGV